MISKIRWILVLLVFGTQSTIPGSMASTLYYNAPWAARGAAVNNPNSSPSSDSTPLASAIVKAAASVPSTPSPTTPVSTADHSSGDQVTPLKTPVASSPTTDTPPETQDYLQSLLNDPWRSALTPPDVSAAAAAPADINPAPETQPNPELTEPLNSVLSKQVDDSLPLPTKSPNAAVVVPENVQPTPAPKAPITSVKTTHFGYPDDPFLDDNSKAGKGAFTQKLIPLKSAALTAQAAKKFGVQPGQSFNVVDNNGVKRTLFYHDIAPEAGTRVDIYDPQGSEKSGEPFQIAQVF